LPGIAPAEAEIDQLIRKLMKNYFSAILLLAAAAFLGIRLAQKEPDYGRAVVINPLKSPKQVAAHLARVFPTPDRATRIAIDELVNCLKMKDLSGAAGALRALQGLPNQTFEQAQVLKGLIEGMQKEVASGVSRGDPNSLGAEEILKRAPCCVK
jgi:hypothetical protein